MAKTSSRTRHIIGLLAVGALSTGLLAYGCSSDDETVAATDEDAGGGGTVDAASSPDTGSTPRPDSGSSARKARANIRPTSDGGTVNGTATFEEMSSGGVKMVLAISGATPPGLHGIHIHQVGECGATDGGAPGSAAGGHWNVGDAGHAHPSADGGQHHTGDMGNITIAANGTGSYTFTNSRWTIAAGDYSVVGRSVIFHAGEDDGVSQPTGDAGARPGCGVIVAE